MTLHQTSPVRPAVKPRKASIAWMEALAATAAIAAMPERLLADVITARADSHGAAAALLSARETHTFASLAARMAQYEHWALRQPLAKGEVVALLMGNRPDYVACWLGLSRAGLVVALINPSLQGAALAHSLTAAAARALIVEDQLVDRLKGTALPPGMALWCHGQPHEGLHSLDAALAGCPRSLPPDRRNVTIADRALLIFTSGTTGLPKAAVVSHRRILNWAFWFNGLLGYTEADRLYNCLPLCHSVGGVVAVAAPLVSGGSTVIAGKFSARSFWQDLRRWDCTAFQYIGELPRYLLAQPPSPDDTAHRLRLVVGNGLRADIWEGFAARFAIPQIVEFYAATEGTFSLYNVEGKPGAIGRIPPFLRHRFPVTLVRQDAETGEVLRGPDGLCLPAATGEAGEALGLISGGDGDDAMFEGYTDAESTARKVLCNVLRPGDRWFRTGDLMRLDAAGHYYFVDRLGDTFRWKGENVSTLEVANLLAGAPGVRDVVVYGVTVPHADGKAGMAFLATDAAFDLIAFTAHARSVLPSYAVPLVLRLGQEAAVTDTFKHRKQALAAEGFDPAGVSDPLFLLQEGQYRPLDRAGHARLASGAVRL
jgi:fatty-acyl-CoA synthase